MRGEQESCLKTLDKKELREIIQSGHINLLIGSGCSQKYLDTLGDIETRMNSDDAAIKEEAQKEYYRLIRKSKAVLKEANEKDKASKQELKRVKQNYDDFIVFWTEAMFNRSLSIVNKQVNVFSTNFDMFFEDACERLEVPYNDGFSGQLRPKFSVGNFNKIHKFKSLQFDNTTDIPLFNIVKLHGSLSWKTSGNEILFSDGSHIKNNLDSKNGKDFSKNYERQIAVINPNADKHLNTVLNTNYASMLRKFTLELEKENSVLFVIGFSLGDEHIRDLLYSVMQTNPTLVVVYLSFSHIKDTPNRTDLKKKKALYEIAKEENKRANLYTVSPEDGQNMPFDVVTEYLATVLYGEPKLEDDDDNDKKAQ